MWPNPQESADLATFTEEILNGKLHFWRSDASEFHIFLFMIDVNHNSYILGSALIQLTLFFLMFLFDPPVNFRKPKVFWCFQGDQKGTLGRKGLIYNSLPTD